MRLEAGFESTGNAPREARELIRAQMLDRVPATTLADVLTIVSELVANAVNHGHGGEARLRMEVAGESVIGDVENDGYAPIEHADPSPDDLSGLGLHIVDAIADSWSVEHRDGTVTVVRFEVSFPSSGGDRSARRAPGHRGSSR